jgi:hypothetical protein
MKRKIQHDAVNNQEDEDSSICTLCLLNDDSPDEKEKKSVENSAIHLSSEASKDKDE